MEKIKSFFTFILCVIFDSTMLVGALYSFVFTISVINTLTLDYWDIRLWESGVRFVFSVFSGIFIFLTIGAAFSFVSERSNRK